MGRPPKKVDKKEAAKPTEEQPKRGRGRPRKVPAAATNEPVKRKADLVMGGGEGEVETPDSKKPKLQNKPTIGPAPAAQPDPLVEGASGTTSEPVKLAEKIEINPALKKIEKPKIEVKPAKAEDAALLKNPEEPEEREPTVDLSGDGTVVAPTVPTVPKPPIQPKGSQLKKDDEKERQPKKELLRKLRELEAAKKARLARDAAETARQREAARARVQERQTHVFGSEQVKKLMEEKKAEKVKKLQSEKNEAHLQMLMKRAQMLKKNISENAEQPEQGASSSKPAESERMTEAERSEKLKQMHLAKRQALMQQARRKQHEQADAAGMMRKPTGDVPVKSGQPTRRPMNVPPKGSNQTPSKKASGPKKDLAPGEDGDGDSDTSLPPFVPPKVFSAQWLEEKKKNEILRKNQREILAKKRIEELEQKRADAMKGDAPSQASVPMSAKQKEIAARNAELVEKLQQVAKDPAVRVRQCQVCFTTFRTADKLKRHEISHSDETEAMCNFCNQPIKYKYNLKSHMLKCGKRLREANEENFLRTHYPEFMKRMDLSMKDLSLSLPTLEGMPYKMDKYGHITGFDPSLDVQLHEMLPSYCQHDPEGKRTTLPTNMAFPPPLLNSLPEPVTREMQNVSSRAFSCSDFPTQESVSWFKALRESLF
ncbi:unnamed protein product [Caenorhabditis sp. 36 PRJEB53466]|nr:unnamed protein product [Caenorhabditis sp. 36 PRJEB53466]